MENNNKDIELGSSGPVDDFNLGLLIFVINKSIVWMVLIIILSVSGAFIYLRYAPPIYQATTTLMLKEEKSTEILGLKDLLKEPDQQVEISREIQLLKSNLFVQRVVKDLPLQISYFKEGKTKFVNTDLYVGSPFEVTGKVKSSMIYDVPVYVRLISPRQVQIVFTMEDKEQEYTGDTGSLFTNSFFDIRVHIRGDIDAEDLKGYYYFEFKDANDMISEVADKIEILPLDASTKTIKLQYKDRNPQRAKDIMATVADEFIKFDVERKNESLYNILRFINNQIDTFANAASELEDSITGLKINDKYVEPSNDYLNSLAEKSMDYDSKFRDIDYDISLMRSFKQLLTRSKEYGNLPSLNFRVSTITFEPEIAAINTLQQQRNVLLLDATVEHPEIRLLDKQIEDQKIKLNKTIDNTITGLQDSKSLLRDEYQKYLDEISRMPELQSKYQQLDKISDTKNDFVMNLYDQKAQYLIASAGIVSDYVVLEKAKNETEPVSPNTNMVKIAGFAIGLLIGLIMIVIRYLLQNTISSVEDIEKKTTAPLLGIIPTYKEDLERSQIVVTQDPKSAITESFRALRTNLQFISNTPGPKILSTTSTIPGEGKTFVSLNTAAILTLLNKRVIILDFDMRKPRLDRIFEVESHKGISTILSGQTGVDECIMESGLPHLDFITSGPVPPNPSELILLPKLHEVLAYLKTKYDYIIIDTPPIGLVTDALEILKISDYPIYILRAAYSNRNFVYSINRIITESKIKNLSIVVNDYGRGASGYSYSYGYNYSYSYGYGYGYYGSKYGQGYYTSTPKQAPTSWIKKIFGAK
ncbi:MAG TPA: polysaccharide biosynthesis tyrosine autokinase [Chitinophagales bacterium]|nr:polysaccharide biosynthesis tyrosine autokinase [Chitinophagales bacterium]